MTRDELIEMQAKTDAIERVNMRTRLFLLEAALERIMRFERPWSEVWEIGAEVMTLADMERVRSIKAGSR